jgi:L-lactate dehydrogenase complex protein LldF
MASEEYKKFYKAAEKKAFDLDHRATIRFNISRYDSAVEKGKNQFVNLELAKKRAASVKQRVVNNLEKYLKEFASNFERNGGKIIWVSTAQEAVGEILNIAQRNQAKRVVKSKSMTTEEIEINDALAKHDIEVVETDLGEYIVQIAGEKPYHIVTPAMHKSKEDIAALFHQKFNTPEESTPEELTAFVREKLRQKFTNADIGITGSNFLLADIGAIALTENEGNAIMSVAFPKTHIAIAGIEKILPSIHDLNLFWPLLSSHGTGQKVTVYNSIISGPRSKAEINGPDEMYLILIDNGRSDLLKKPLQKIALSCIRCGACLNACPIYKNIGGHSFGTTYSGPIGSVITPHMKGMKEYGHLSFACSLCGKCEEVCPVMIPLPKLLLENRHDFVSENHEEKMDKIAMKAFNFTMQKRKRMDFWGAKSKNFALNIFFKKTWGPGRKLPEIAPKPFKEMYKEKWGE